MEAPDAVHSKQSSLDMVVKLGLVLLCCLALAGLLTNLVGLGGPAASIPAPGSVIRNAVDMIGAGSGNAVIVVVDQRCPSCRANHSYLARVVEAARAQHLTTHIVALGDAALDSTYYTMLGPTELIVRDPDGLITRVLGVRSVPAVIVSRDYRVTYAATPATAEWSWKLFTAAL